MKLQTKAAIIGGLAIIVAALINVLPELLKSNSSSNTPAEVQNNYTEEVNNSTQIPTQNTRSSQSNINQSTNGDSSPAVVNQDGDVEINIAE